MNHLLIFNESRKLESVWTVTELFLFWTVSNLHAVQFHLLLWIVNFTTEHHTKTVKYSVHSVEHCYWICNMKVIVISVDRTPNDRLVLFNESKTLESLTFTELFRLIHLTAFAMFQSRWTKTRCCVMLYLKLTPVFLWLFPCHWQNFVDFCDFTVIH